MLKRNQKEIKLFICLLPPSVHTNYIRSGAPTNHHRQKKRDEKKSQSVSVSRFEKQTELKKQIRFED